MEMKFTLKDEDYSMMKEEIIDTLNSDDRMNVYEMLELIEKHWNYEVVKEFVRGRENFLQWEIERLVYGAKEFPMRELVLEKEEGQYGLLDGNEME